MKESIEILQSLLADIKQQKEDIDTLIRQNLFKIEKIGKMLDTLYGKEDPEFRLFSPYDSQTIHSEEIAKQSKEKEELEKENISLYRKTNKLSREIEQLETVISRLKGISY